MRVWLRLDELRDMRARSRLFSVLARPPRLTICCLVYFTLAHVIAAAQNENVDRELASAGASLIHLEIP